MGDCAACGRLNAFLQSDTSPACWSCHASGRRDGARGANGDKRIENGYVQVRMKNRWVYEHRYVAEKKLKRKLRKGEIIHHRNRDRLDNRPGNLQLVRSQAEHMRLHGEHL